MNSLAGNPNSPILGASSQADDASARTRMRQSSLSLGVPTESRAGLFLGLSILVHVTGVLLYASAPGPALAASDSQATEITVEMLDLREPEPEVMPLGNLEAPLTPAPESVPSPAPALAKTQPQNMPGATQPNEAPEVLTASNPYGAASDTVFTSGSGQGKKLVVASAGIGQASSGAQFGVEGGSAAASEEARLALAAWHRRVREQLAAAATRNYPMRAQKLGQQGTVKISVSISDNGQVLGTNVASSSSYSMLDAAALSGLRSVAIVDAPPRGTGATTLTVPVTFRLD